MFRRVGWWWLGVAACSAADGEALRLPPPPSLEVHAPALVAGELVELSVSGAPPGARVNLGLAGRLVPGGLCPAALAPTCLDLGPPAQALGAAVADAVGVARWSWQVPDRPEVVLQAVLRSGSRVAVSPALSVAVSAAAPDDPCGFVDGHAILFVTQLPIPEDFGTRAATFGNHRGSPQYAGRGGDLYVRYPDGTLRNLTAEAGLGEVLPDGSEDPERSIAVREPAVHWSGRRALVSIATGAHPGPWVSSERYWQLYTVDGLCPGEAPVFERVPLPTDYNHVAPTWGSDDRVLFVSDMPPSGPADRHLYPLRDEYEGSPITSGIWSYDPNSGDLRLLQHSPSGSFGPLVDSFGRVVYSRWDHLKRDMVGPGDGRPIFDLPDESPGAQAAAPGVWFDEVFPELQGSVQQALIAHGALPADFGEHYGTNDFNQFFPWQVNQDGSGEETLNHVGRQELGGSYGSVSRPDDPALSENYRQFAADVDTAVLRDISTMQHLAEDPLVPGRFYATLTDEFNAKSGGQLVTLDAAPDRNADDMALVFVTDRATAYPLNPGEVAEPAMTGLYRDPLPLSDGRLIAVHTPPVGRSSAVDPRDGPSAASAYQYRLRELVPGPHGMEAGPYLTDGIEASVSFWYNGNNFRRTYQGVLWELEPVEVVARPRPPLTRSAVDPIEAAVIADAGAELADLRAWLAARDLALIVSRDVTQRDHHDLQQPYNLAVPGGVRSIAPSCADDPACVVYDVTHLQVFEARYVRGQDWGWRPDDPSFDPASYSPVGGRRVLPRPLTLEAPGQDPVWGAGTFPIASDGSVAAIVPAGRALSWQLINEAAPGDPRFGTDAVVRERYWVTLAPGEIRGCPSCHGVNTASQTGDPEPEHAPAALSALVAAWVAAR